MWFKWSTSLLPYFIVRVKYNDEIIHTVIRNQLIKLRLGSASLCSGKQILKLSLVYLRGLSLCLAAINLDAESRCESNTLGWDSLCLQQIPLPAQEIV